MAGEIFVSGRLCLFGEHSDWAGEYRLHNPEIETGKTLVIGTSQGLYAKIAKLDRQVLTITASSYTGEVFGPKTFEMDPETLLAEAQAGGFWSYVAGTAYRLVVAHDVGGLEINNYKTTLHMSKGLSSSAAICVMVARAFNLQYHLKLTTRGEMEFAYLGEITTPSKCGRMDQACAYGSIPVLMTFDADILHIERVQLKCSLYLVLVDLKASKDTTTILKSLQAAYPVAQDEKQSRLQELLGIINHKITAQALKAMADGDAEALGALMVQAQLEFDGRAGPLCPSQLTAPILHTVLNHQDIQPYIWGGKGVGSQGDGTAQLLCKGPEEQLKVMELCEQMGMSPMELTIYASVASEPAIHAAGRALAAV